MENSHMKHYFQIQSKLKADIADLKVKLNKRKYFYNNQSFWNNNSITLRHSLTK